MCLYRHICKCRRHLAMVDECPRNAIGRVIIPCLFMTRHNFSHCRYRPPCRRPSIEVPSFATAGKIAKLSVLHRGKFGGWNVKTQPGRSNKAAIILNKIRSRWEMALSHWVQTTARLFRLHSTSQQRSSMGGTKSSLTNLVIRNFFFPSASTCLFPVTSRISKYSWPFL